MLPIFVAVLFVGASALHDCADYNNAAHSACLPRDSSLVSDSDIQTILDKHNELRRTVSVPEGVPNNLIKFAWDEDLAAAAQGQAETCTRGHDDTENREIPWYGSFTGQNAAYGYGDWEAAIQGWYDEISDFNYDAAKTGTTGHFTQVVGYRATRVGCGFANCPSSKYARFYYCNYWTGQYGNEAETPFAIGGGRASACPGNEENGLCAGACYDKVCQHDGTLQLSDCSCQCRGPYGGDDCTTVVGTTTTTRAPGTCATQEADYCGVLTRRRPSYCTIFTNVPEECPIMCDASCNHNEVYESPLGCTFEGTLKTALDCEGRADQSWCGSSWGCTDCEDFTNVATDCPFMCGICRS